LQGRVFEIWQQKQPVAPDKFTLSSLGSRVIFRSWRGDLKERSSARWVAAMVLHADAIPDVQQY
jgi:hypothetical protein